MENSKQFKLIIDLSNFFCDHRTVARIFVKKNFKTIEDIENHIKSIFEIDNFYLSTQNQFLPSCEDVRILDHNDVIRVIKKQLNLNYDFTQNTVNEEQDRNIVNKKKKVKKKIAYQLAEEEIPEKVEKTKKRKTFNDHFEEIEAPSNKIQKLESNNYNETTLNCKIKNGAKESLYNSSHFKLNYKKNEVVKPSMDLFLQHAKTNLVKIENIGNITDSSSKVLENGGQKDENLKEAEEKIENGKIETHLINGFHEPPISLSSSIISTNKIINPINIKLNSPMPNENEIQGADSLNGFDKDEQDKSIDTLEVEDTVSNENRMNEAHQEFDNHEKTLSPLSSKAINETKNNDCLNIKSQIVSCEDNQTITESYEIIPVPDKKFNRPGLGVGQLLQSLRDSSTIDSESNSEFVTVRRKRRRVRKRKPKPNCENISISSTDVSICEPSIIDIKSTNTLTPPSIHIKFVESSDEETKQTELEESDLKFENIFNPTDGNIEKGVLMTNLKPKIGDYVGFKILRLTDNFTPELSSFFVGNILDYDPVTTKTSFQILYDETKNHLENIKETYIWSDLKDTRLLHP